MSIETAVPIYLKIIGDSTRQAVDMQNIHTWLKPLAATSAIEVPYNEWMQKQIQLLNFEKHVDFTVSENGIYYATLKMAMSIVNMKCESTVDGSSENLKATELDNYLKNSIAAPKYRTDELGRGNYIDGLR